MKIKQIAAVTLCGALLMNFAGCDAFGVRKELGRVDGVIKLYVDALNGFDSDGILELTDWDEDSDEYKNVETLLGRQSLEDAVGAETVKCYESILSSIDVDFKVDVSDLDGDDKATVKVTYEVPDWVTVFTKEHSSESAVIKDIKSTKDTKKIKGKISLEKKDGDWKITDITKLDEVCGFVYATPLIYIEPGVTETEPSEITPTGIDPTGTVFAGSYEQAIGCYMAVLKEYEDGIKTAREVFGFDNVGLIDLDDNTIPELYFLATTDDMKICGDLYVFSYNEAKGDVLQIMYFHNVVYMAADGGGFTFYLTPDKAVLTQSGGEVSLYHHDTMVYDLGWYNDTIWHVDSEYRREEIVDFDTDEQYEKYYKDGIEIEKPDYESIFGKLTGDTVIVLMSSFYPDSGYVEYQQGNCENVQLSSYDVMMDYLKDLI